MHDSINCYFNRRLVQQNIDFFCQHVEKKTRRGINESNDKIIFFCCFSFGNSEAGRVRKKKNSIDACRCVFS